jgi:tetratricopeptide (TPR) repeat protein
MIFALVFGGGYLLSYFMLEKKLAELLYPVLRGPLLLVLENNLKLISYYGWIVVFVFASSLVMLFGHGLREQKKTAFKAAWLFPLLVLMVLPAIVATNLRNQVADIYTKTGEAMMRTKHWDAAHSCFRKAISLEPNQAWRHEKLGFLFYAQAKEYPTPEKDLLFEKAIYHGQKATHLSPLNGALKSNLARMSYTWAADARKEDVRSDRLKVAETLYMKALKTGPNNNLLWKESAQIAAALGRNRVAVQRFERALQLYEHDFESHRNLALLYGELKHYPQALAHAEAALRLAGEEQKVRIELLIEELKGKTG